MRRERIPAARWSRSLCQAGLESLSMAQAWVFQKAAGRCLSSLILAAMFAAPSQAQTTPKARVSPAPRQIILPPIIVAGAQATLAVLDSQGRLLPNVPVELSGGQKLTTDGTGRAYFIATDMPGTMTAKISGRAIFAASTVLVSQNPSGPPASSDPPEVGKVTSYPHVLSLRDRFTLAGSGFRGAADSNRVTLNGDPCLVLASSPISIVALPGPRVPVGDVKLAVSVAGVDAGQFPVSAVILEFSGPAEAANAGSTGNLIVRALGSTAPLVLEVRNGSPSVVQLEKGNVQRLKTSGGDENIATLEVKFVTGGNFSVSARLLSAW